MSRYKLVKVDESPEEIIKRKNKQNKLLILIILLLILGFIIYEVKFAEKSIFNNGDKYEEYDPNYVTEDNSNIKQNEKKETSNIVEGITSNITSNIIITSNVVNSNITSNNVSNSNTVISNNNSNNKSNVTSNGSKDTTKPVISGASFNVGTNSITINLICNDDTTVQNKLKREYSLDGKTWTTSNTFNNLTSNTAYTFYARVTDEAGNVSNVYSKQQKTNVLAARKNVSGVYSRNGINIYVTQLTDTKVVYKVLNGGYNFITLDSSKTTAEKKVFGSWYFDSTDLYANNLKYTYSGSGYESVDNVFRKVFNTDGTFDKSSTYCNGLWTIDSRNKKMHMIANTNTKYGDYDCTILFENNVGTQWVSASYDDGTINDKSTRLDGEYKYTSGFGYVWNITVPVTDGASIIENASGAVYQKSKSYSIEDAIELKLTGKIS